MTNLIHTTPLPLLVILLGCAAVFLALAFDMLSWVRACKLLWRARPQADKQKNTLRPSRNHVTAEDGREHDVLPMRGGPFDGFTADDAGDCIVLTRQSVSLTVRCDSCGAEQTLLAHIDGSEHRIPECTCGETLRFSIDRVEPDALRQHLYVRAKDAFVWRDSRRVDV